MRTSLSSPVSLVLCLLLWTATAPAPYVLLPIGQTRVDRGYDQMYDLAWCGVDFRDFGVEIGFEKPLACADRTAGTHLSRRALGLVRRSHQEG